MRLELRYWDKNEDGVEVEVTAGHYPTPPAAPGLLKSRYCIWLVVYVPDYRYPGPLTKAPGYSYSAWALHQ